MVHNLVSSLSLLLAATGHAWSRSPQVTAALQEVQAMGGWTFVLRRNGASVWKRGGDASDERAPFAVKATILVRAPPRVLAAMLLTRDYDTIRRFNPTIQGGRDLEWRDGRKERVTYVLTKPIWPLR